jgi:hypothetical protein
LGKGITRDDKVLHWIKFNPLADILFGIIKNRAWSLTLNYRFNAVDFQFWTDIAEQAMIFGGRIGKKSTALNPPDTNEDYIYSVPNLPPACSIQPIFIDRQHDPVSKTGTGGRMRPVFHFRDHGLHPKPVLLNNKTMSFAASRASHHQPTRRTILFFLRCITPVPRCMGRQSDFREQSTILTNSPQKRHGSRE